MKYHFSNPPLSAASMFPNYMWIGTCLLGNSVSLETDMKYKNILNFGCYVYNC